MPATRAVTYGRAAAAQPLDREIRVLEYLADHPDGLTVTELSQMLSVHRTVVYGFVSTLADHRLVARYLDGRYRIGMGAGPRGRVETNLQRAAFPWLSTLAEDLGATAFLVVADGEEAVAVLTVEPSRSSFHIAYRPGFRHPLDRGASGIAILAAAPVGAA